VSWIRRCSSVSSRFIAGTLSHAQYADWLMAPKTQYTRSGDLYIAYQVVGEGPIDLLYVPSWISQVEHYWDEPSVARYFERLASFSRLILFDRRGTGLSDPVPDAP